MLTKLGNKLVLGILLSGAIFLALYAALPPRSMLILMNGLFVGAMVGVAVTFGQLLWSVLLGHRPYDRVRQMTLGMATHWIATSLLIGSSIVLVSADAGQQTAFAGLAGRYLAVVAATLKVTAPDYGLGIFYGRDRKLLIAGLILGGLAAACVIVFQQT